MKLWYLGDSILSAQLQSVATALGMELVDSSKPSALMEEVWIDQINEAMFRAKPKPDCSAVIFVNNPDYDSEVLINILLHRLPNITRVVLIVTPANAKAAEGMLAHFEGPRFRLIAVDNLIDVESRLINELS